MKRLVSQTHGWHSHWTLQLPWPQRTIADAEGVRRGGGGTGEGARGKEEFRQSINIYNTKSFVAVLGKATGNGSRKSSLWNGWMKYYMVDKQRNLIYWSAFKKQCLGNDTTILGRMSMASWSLGIVSDPHNVAWHQECVLWAVTKQSPPAPAPGQTSLPLWVEPSGRKTCGPTSFLTLVRAHCGVLWYFRSSHGQYSGSSRFLAPQMVVPWSH